MKDAMTPPDDAPQPSAPYVSKVDRRTTLAWLATAAAATPALGRAQSPNDRAEKPVVAAPQTERPGPKGYGTDPALVSPKPAPWPRLMTPAQLQVAAVLCDFILPASADAPSATALHVPDFLDEWVSAPYPQQVADRPLLLYGLDWLEEESRRRFSRGLTDLPAIDLTALLTPLTVRTTERTTLNPHAFFRRFRALTIGAYYTTPAGFKDIGYIGNVARSADPGPSPAVVAELETRLKQMGL